MITNQQMRRALTIVIELAKNNIVAPNELEFDEIRKKQLEAIKMVEYLQTVMFTHNLTRVNYDVDGEVK